ncbi:hypothetical protein D3C78_557370 [compost metagenome]
MASLGGFLCTLAKPTEQTTNTNYVQHGEDVIDPYITIIIGALVKDGHEVVFTSYVVAPWQDNGGGIVDDGCNFLSCLKTILRRDGGEVRTKVTFNRAFEQGRFAIRAQAFVS